MADRVEYELVIDDRGAISTAKRFGDAVKAMSDPGPVDKQAAAFQRLMDRLEPARAAAERLAKEQKLLDNAYLNGQLTLERYMASGQKLRAEQAAGVQVQARQAQSLASMAGGFIAAQLGIQTATKALELFSESVTGAAQAQRLGTSLRDTFSNLKMNVDASVASTEAFSRSMMRAGYDDDATTQAIQRMVVVTKDLSVAQTLVTTAFGIAQTGQMDYSTALDLMAKLQVGQMRALNPLVAQFGLEINKNADEAVQAAQAQEQLIAKYYKSRDALADSTAAIQENALMADEMKKGFGGPFLSVMEAAGGSIDTITQSMQTFGAIQAHLISSMLILPEVVILLAKAKNAIWPKSAPPLVDSKTAAEDIAWLALYNKYTKEASAGVALMSAHGEEYEKRRAESAKGATSALGSQASAATQAAAAQSQLLATYNPTHAQVIKLAEDEGKLNEIVRKGGEDAYWASAALESLYEARRKLFTIADEAMPVIDIKRPEKPVTAGVEGVPMDTSAQQAFVDTAKQQQAYTKALTDAQAFMDQMGMTFAGGFAGLILQWDQYNAQVEAGQMTSAQAITMKWSSVLAFLGGIMGQVAAGMNVQSKADFERQKNLQKASVAMSAGSAIMSAWAGAFASTPFPPAAAAIAAVMTALILAQSAMRISQINAQQFTPPAAKGFETGTPYVPKTGLYQLHEGEKVVPRSVAAQRWGDRDTRSLGGQTNYNLDFSGAVLLDHDVVNKIGGMIEDQVERGHLRRAG